jgi:signal transduction histidine kinase
LRIADSKARARRGSPDPAELNLPSAIRNPQSAIELSLIDTGQGMPAEVLARIWQPFYSTKASGTGLGLATTRKIIEAHGGTIDAQSAVGKGTKFMIRLPALADVPATPPAMLARTPAG